MADVERVKGPGGADERVSGSGKKDKPKGSEFEDLMKVGETDPEEKRKRREPAEKEVEEGKLDDIHKTTPKEHVTPFDLPKTSKKAKAEESFEVSSTPGPASVSRTPPSQPEEIAPTNTSAARRKRDFAQPSEEQSPIDKKREESQKGTLLPNKAPVIEPGKEELLEAQEHHEEVKAKIEKETEQNLPLPTEEEPSKKELAKEEEKIELPIAREPTGVVSPLQPETVQPVSPIPAYTRLDPQVLELFERMVGVMSIMRDTGITETTIHLNADQFSSSAFYGSQIVIREYATAPKVYNIEINTTAQGSKLFNANLPDLLVCFQTGNYNFKVNQINVNLSEESEQIFRRKGRAGDESKDERQQ